MTNGFAHYYTPSCYLDVVIRSTMASHLASSHTYGPLAIRTRPSVRFGTCTSTPGFLELEWAGYFWEEGGREGLEQDRTILLGMSTHKNHSLSGTQRINRGG